MLGESLKYIFPDKICDYFGVKIAIYFAYLGHYTKSLMLPAFLGLMLWFISGQDQVGVFLILLSLVLTCNPFILTTLKYFCLNNEDHEDHKIDNQSLTLTARGSTLDVCRRQILTSNVNPRAVRLKVFLMVVDP